MLRRNDTNTSLLFIYIRYMTASRIIDAILTIFGPPNCCYRCYQKIRSRSCIKVTHILTVNRKFEHLLFKYMCVVKLLTLFYHF